MIRPIVTLVCVVVFAGSFTANAVNTVDSATIPLATPQHEPAQLPTLGPLTQVAHVYGDNIEIGPEVCFAADHTVVFGNITLTTLNAPAGETIVVASVVYDIVNFGGGTMTDDSVITTTYLTLSVSDTGCSNAQPQDVAATITGEFTNGDTFSIQALVPNN